MFKGLYFRALFFCAAFICAASAAVYAQKSSGAVRLNMVNRGAYSLIERSDWSRYDDGKYLGHVYREVRSSVSPQAAPGRNSFVYQGHFFVLEETLRDMRQSAQAVDEVVSVNFEISGDGTFRIAEDRGFPSLRGFPVFPAEAVRPGARWTAPGDRVVDPLNIGQPVVTSFMAEYEYRGIEEYRGIPVYHIFAKYASRYPGNGAPREQHLDGQQDFSGLQGTHEVDILIRVSDGLPLMMRDTLDETFSWPNGKTVRFKGFTLTFGEGRVPLNRDTVIASLENNGDDKTPPASSTSGSGRKDKASKNGSPDNPAWAVDSGIDVAVVSEGIRLTVKDIRFIADSDGFLPEEYPRLDTIAQALKQIPDRTFLVEGHTAAVGRPSNEMELSIQRAKRMVDELVGRGIPASRFMYKGWGGTKPLADNTSETGRTRNRRVEITILE
ncbi:MAG: OmpA family protein [Treponema sp.]|jgi:outer membrane protein OmpA-like peptidoglycan-associated protein|nr:OmpA family protein [Treponema sp.]